MWKELSEFAKSRGWKLQQVFARKPATWPQPIGAAVSRGSSEGDGLHNLTAKALKLSPETQPFPKTDWGVPKISAMTDAQKAQFLDMVGHSGNSNILMSP